MTDAAQLLSFPKFITPFILRYRRMNQYEVLGFDTSARTEYCRELWKAQ